MDTPKVSFFLMVYNNAPYIKKAIRSVFAQTWPNLQIVISDDASTDGTADLIREEVAAYRGPHEIKLNFNAENQCLTHINTIIKLCDGDFIVQGHGDDMAHPERAAKMVEAWQRTGATLVTTNALVVDGDDKPLRLWRDPNARYDNSLATFVRERAIVAAFGAGMGWSRELMDVWGPQPPGPRQMDLIYAFRACLMGGCVFLPEPLVYYRDHGDNMSMWAKRRQAKSEVELTLIEERNLGNVVANLVAFVDTIQAHLQRHPQDAAARAALTPLIQQILTLTGQWTRMRHDMACRRIGVV